MGLIAAVSAAMGIVASIPAGILSDRIGRKRLLMVSAVVFATAPFLNLFVTGRMLWTVSACMPSYHW